MNSIHSPTSLERPSPFIATKGNTLQKSKELPGRLNLMWDRGLLFLGILLILAGIGYFFAHSGTLLSHHDRLRLAGGVVLTSLIAATWASLDRFLGKLLLLAASAMVGVYLGVFGQIYQTGAENYELFAWWALLILPWVVLGRFVPLWILWLGLLNMALSLFWPVAPFFTPLDGHLIFRYQTIGLALLNGTALLCRQWAASRGVPWLDRGWSALVLLAGIVIPASMETIGEIFHGEQRDAFIAYALYVLLAISLGCYFIRRCYTLPALAVIALGAYGVLLTLVAHTQNLGQPPSIWIWLESGLIILFIFAAASLFLAPQRHLNQPWIFRTILTVGAWLLSLIGLAFLIILVGPQPKISLAFFGVTLLVLAVSLSHQKWGAFAAQSALSVSLAAQVIIYCGLGGKNNLPLATAAIVSVGLALLLYLAYPSFLSRVLTCFVALQLVLAWIYADANGHFSTDLQAQPYLSHLILPYWTLHLAAICFGLLASHHASCLTPLWLALIASLAAWQIESLSHFLPQPAGLIPSLQTGLTALTLFGAVFWASGGLSVLRQKSPLFIGLALFLAALVYFDSGGTLLALVVMLLGVFLQNRALAGLSLILFLIVTTYSYYNHNLSLLAESGALVSSGLVILILRTALSGQRYLKDLTL